MKPDGGYAPSKKGTALSIEHWEKFLGLIEDINQAIAQKQTGVPTTSDSGSKADQKYDQK